MIQGKGRGDGQDNLTSSVAWSEDDDLESLYLYLCSQNSQLPQVAWFLVVILVGRPGYFMALHDPARMQRQYTAFSGRSRSEAEPR